MHLCFGFDWFIADVENDLREPVVKNSNTIIALEVGIQVGNVSDSAGLIGDSVPGDKVLERDVVVDVISKDGSVLVEKGLFDKDLETAEFTNKVELFLGRNSVEELERERDFIPEVDDVEAVPPGFDTRIEEVSDENSMETTVHVTEELSESEEETMRFSSGRARMIREKLGICFLDTRNVDKAFADFCKNRQKEIENNRKKSVVSDVSKKLRKQGGKRGFAFKVDSGRNIKS